MSLATYASPYNESDNINSNNAIEEKRRHRNKTLKKRDIKSSNPKVDAMMKQIYSENDEEDNSGSMSDFQPLGAPESVGAMNSERGVDTPQRESYDYDAVMKQEMSNDNSNMGSYGDDSNENNMFHATQQGVMYNGTGQNSYTGSNSYAGSNSYTGQNSYAGQNAHGMDQDELMRKMNYIIYMLEEQKNEKTDNIMEELVLYTFLGVFVIFVVDSFAKVGKYVR